MTATAADRLASMREATIICALAMLAGLSADPSAAIDALSAINPRSADGLCEQLAERDDTTPEAIRGRADLWRIEYMAAGSPAKAPA